MVGKCSDAPYATHSVWSTVDGGEASKNGLDPDRELRMGVEMFAWLFCTVGGGVISEDDGGGGGDVAPAFSEPLIVSLENEAAVDNAVGGLLIWLGVSGTAISAGGSKEL